MNKLYRNFWKVHSFLRKGLFFKFGRGSIIYSPLQIDNPFSISIGDHVSIMQNSWIMGGNKKNCITLYIGNKVDIGHYAHIIACFDIKIEDNVLIADKVFISDCSHNYQDINRPIMDQDISFIKSIRIGRGSWIGENVCICGASIGKNCVIGANSVVLEDIPDYCVAAGIPAKVIKKYNKEEKKWVRVS